MSGVVKGVGKVFKAVGKVVKKIAKPVAIAAAVYFTGGLALSAFGPTQAFAAALPGFGISSTGAATGIFSKAAAALGLEGGLVAGAQASGAAGATAASKVAAMNVANAAKAGAATGAATGGTAAATTLASTVAPAAAGMTLTEKLLLASMGSKAVGAFLAPSLGSQYSEAKRWRGAFYGTYEDGSGAPAAAQPPGGLGPATPERHMNVTPAAPVGQAPSPVASPSRELMPSQPRQTVQTTPAMPSAPSVDTAQPTNNAPIEPKRLMQPGVRYV